MGRPCGAVQHESNVGNTLPVKVHVPSTEYTTEEQRITCSLHLGITFSLGAIAGTLEVIPVKRTIKRRPQVHTLAFHVCRRHRWIGISLGQIWPKKNTSRTE